MSLKFQVIGPPSLLIGLFAGPARRGTAFFAAAFFGAAFFAGFLLLAVFFAIFLRATFIPLSMTLHQPPSTLAHSPSLPGIARRKTRVNALMTRQSILFNEALFPMDARVKPGHDESRTPAAGMTSREALARLSAAGEMPCRGSTVSGAGTAGQRPQVVN